MAKKQTRNRKMAWLPVNSSLSLGALVDDTVILAEIANLTEDFYAVGAKLNWSIRSATSGEVPITVGMAHSDYSATEIEECIDSALTGPGSKIEQERSRRLVRTVGAFVTSGADLVLDEGREIKTPLKFMIQDGHGLAFWAKNQSGGTLAGGAVLRITGHYYGRWVY